MYQLIYSHIYYTNNEQKEFSKSVFYKFCILFKIKPGFNYKSFVVLNGFKIDCPV